MKKIIGILSIFLVLGLIAAIIFGFSQDVRADLSSGSKTAYKLLTGLLYFFYYLPAVMITGYVVSCSVNFGRSAEGSYQRFSSAMAGRFKSVMITSLIITFVLTMGNEVFLLRIRQKRSAIINQPKIVNNYIRVGENFFAKGHYEKSIVYADAALKLNPNSISANALREKADIELNRANTSNLRFKLYNSSEAAEKVDHVKIDAEQISEVYGFYLRAQECFKNEEWFNAHYYAQLGINLATPKDPNLESLRVISTSAWNNLTQWHNLAKTNNQIEFEKKYEGYLALVENDNLKAYYIFRDLYNSSREMQTDPDVNFYLGIAENRINERSFFIDEFLELRSFETANDVYFAYSYKDGSKDIIYFKGMTNVKETGNTIQYLRELTVKSVSRNGELIRSLYVPYAKVLPVSVKTINSTTKKLLGIDDETDFVPYIMLHSVSRDLPAEEIKPVYTYNFTDDTSGNSDFMMLPIPYNDFVMLESSTNNPSILPLLSLYKLVSKAAEYGYSAEVYGQVLLNRLFYPLWILIFFIFMASFGWNNRMDGNQYFKFTWAFSFPFFMIVSLFLYRIVLFVFKLLNYTILGTLGSSAAITGCLVAYTFILVVVSLYFLSRSTKK